MEYEKDRRFQSDEVFKAINKHFITLKDNEMSEYNVHLKRVLNKFVEHMRDADELFHDFFHRIAYVGSYYEGLKVGRPEEFDLNIIINLPTGNRRLMPSIDSKTPKGYIKLQAIIPTVGEFGMQYEGAGYKWKNFRTLDGWLQNDYLDQDKFRRWFESVIAKALERFPHDGRKSILEADGKEYLLYSKKSGPAFTLKIDVPLGHTVDVDLVPALEFSNPLPEPFIERNTQRKNWFAIPKPLEDPNSSIFWRPSFYERERQIMKDLKGVKAVIRQMKKLRDTRGFHILASYYLKTLFLWECSERYVDIENWSQTQVFFHMLKKLHDACNNKDIHDFWNPQNNFLAKFEPIAILEVRNELNNIIKKIERGISDDPYIIAKYILTPDEFKMLKQQTLEEEIPDKPISSSHPLSNNIVPRQDQQLDAESIIRPLVCTAFFIGAVCSAIREYWSTR